MAVPYFILLMALLTLLLLSSTVGTHPTGLSILTLLVLVAGTNASNAGRRPRKRALVLGFFWLVIRWGGPYLGLEDSEMWSKLPFLVFLVDVTGIILIRVANRAIRVDFNTICGAICVYLLNGISWAVLFVLMEGWCPGSFSITGDTGSPSFQQLIYFSFTTITTLGYGDISPINPLVRTLSVFEAMAGVFYVAIVMARLVSVYVDRP
ncbi:MAG: two pore domain potassium channel family protein [Kordiimonadaceae bacterium]|nr:two pore domain potassium channel family protein [Kordiimonadaceae bacterium]